MRSLYIVLSLLSLLFSFTCLSKTIPLSEESKVSILTCSTGNKLYSLFGHTAIRINDPKIGLDIVYNFGAFDFSTDYFYLKFIRGNLQYFMSTDSFENFVYTYRYDNRSIYEQILALSQKQKQQVFDILNYTLNSDERFYTYKFLDKNCTSIVVDLINKVFERDVIVKNENIDVTYRDILYLYIKNHFYENLGINITFGKKVDLKATKIFLPNELLENLNKPKYNDHILDQPTKIIYLAKNEKVPFSIWNNYYTFSIFLIGIILFNKKKVNSIYLSFIGLLGLFFSVIGFFSQHQEVLYNYNILLFNPSSLLVLFFYYKKNKLWCYRIIVLNISMLIIYLVLMINKSYLTLILPIFITSFIILVRFKKLNDQRNN